MKIINSGFFLLVTTMWTITTTAFIPSYHGHQIQRPAFTPITISSRVPTSIFAKYKTMDEILALFPEEKPVLINFYDANTENAIKGDIMVTKKMIADRATLVSIKTQDYPDMAKLWDANERSPSMILFKDGQPVTRIYEETDPLVISAKVTKFCD